MKSTSTGRLTAAAVAIGLTLGSLAALAAPASAASACSRTTITPTPRPAVALLNCSGASAATIAATLRNTDAADTAKINTGDLIMANQQWLVWIDRTLSPGTVRGLWPINGGSFAGQRDPRGRARSLVAIEAGFGSGAGDPIYGLRGLHVELYPAAGNSGTFYTYQRGAPAARQETFGASSAQLRYVSYLYDFTARRRVVTGLNGVTTDASWTVQYDFTPISFVISTEVAAAADVNFNGDLGGLLLLTNPACRVAWNYGDCGNTTLLAQSSLHRVTGNPAWPAGGSLLWNNITWAKPANYTEERYLVPGNQPPAGAVSTTSTDTAWRLSYDDPNQGTIALRSSISTTDPATGPGRNNPTLKVAYHYNETVPALGGLNGFGSFDVVMVSPANGSIAVGPNRGVLRFQLVVGR
jgi:hypothetical protein